MSVNINIDEGMPSVNIETGKQLRFQSSDGSDYEVNFDDSDITDATLPFSVPGDGKIHKLKVKDKAKKQNYTCYIYEAEDTSEKLKKSKKEKKSVEKPKMIIKVE